MKQKLEKKTKKQKKQLTRETIFKIMLIVTVSASLVFLLKNIMEKNIQGALVIGICLVTLATLLYIFKCKKTDSTKKEFIISIYLNFLIFFISLNSGASYSDDFPFFLAVIGLTGMYLEPKFTKTQIILADIFLVIMYIVHPEKAENLSQYILCFAVFNLAACLFSLTIKRGRTFIEISELRAEEAENLLSSIRNMGTELNHDFQLSSVQIDNNTNELQRGSLFISKEANDISDSCIDVHDKIAVTEQHIQALNSEVQKFESMLTENQANMTAMTQQLMAVSATILEANEVFRAMEEKMTEVANIAEKLNAISFSTTILSLNASVEASRVGDAGAGFQVVATEMKNLSEDSNTLSEQVGEVVKQLLNQVEQTSSQFKDSTNALKESETTMNELHDSFRRLKEQFASLYNNIEAQNNNVTQVDTIFNQLENRITDMKNYSSENQIAVSSIVDAMDNYKKNINRVIDNTRNV